MKGPKRCPPSHPSRAPPSRGFPRGPPSATQRSERWLSESILRCPRQSCWLTPASPGDVVGCGRLRPRDNARFPVSLRQAVKVSELEGSQPAPFSARSTHGRYTSSNNTSCVNQEFGRVTLDGNPGPLAGFPPVASRDMGRRDSGISGEATFRPAIRRPGPGRPTT